MHPIQLQASSVILDGVIAYRPDGQPNPLMELVVQRVVEVEGIVDIQFDHTTGRVRVDPSHFVNASIDVAFALCYWLADERGIAIEDVVAELRETLASPLP